MTVSIVLDQLRRLDRRLHNDRGRRSAWAWVIPIAGFAVWVTILVVAGALTGVWVAEYLPTALIEGVVIAGLLFVACMPPEGASAESDHGNRGPAEPPPPRPDSTPTIWRVVFTDRDADTVLPEEHREEAPREPVGAPRAS